MHPSFPWFTSQANAILSSRLQKTHSGLEWGSGRSTLWFAKRVAGLTSVEHDPIWYQKTLSSLKDNNITNVNYLLYETKDDKQNDKHFSYISVVDKFHDNSLDFIVVDGVFRDECALRSLDKLKPGGLIIIDNINRFFSSASISPNSRTYKMGYASQNWELLSNRLKNWRWIWTTNGIWDTAIFIKSLDHSH